jgi:ribonuclease E
MNTTEDGAQMAPGAPENGASASTTSKPKTPIRRRRAPNRRRAEAENTTPAIETEAAEARTETHAEPRAETAPVAASETQPAVNGATESAGEQAEQKAAPARPRRARNAKSRRPAVELVRPPTPEQAPDEAYALVDAAPDAPVDGAALCNAPRQWCARSGSAAEWRSPQRRPPHPRRLRRRNQLQRPRRARILR